MQAALETSQREASLLAAELEEARQVADAAQALSAELAEAQRDATDEVRVGGCERVVGWGGVCPLSCKGALAFNQRGELGSG